MTDLGPQTLFWLVFAAIAAFLLAPVVRLGFKGAMFGGRIVETFGPIDIDRIAIMSGSVRTHVVEQDGKRKVGLEIVYRSPLSWQMTPVRLTTVQARALAAQLNEAASHAY